MVRIFPTQFLIGAHDNEIPGTTKHFLISPIITPGLCFWACLAIFRDRVALRWCLRKAREVPDTKVSSEGLQRGKTSATNCASYPNGKHVSMAPPD